MFLLLLRERLTRWLAQAAGMPMSSMYSELSSCTSIWKCS